MARHPVWAEAEWALLIDLVLRYEDVVEESEIRGVQHVVRARALMSEDPLRRRQATDPSFRSLGGIWAQYYVARRTRDEEERWRAPERLQRAWARYEEDPEAIHALVAQAVSPLVEERQNPNPYRLGDQAALRLFLLDLAELLGETVDVVRMLPGAQASSELMVAYTDAWSDLTERNVLADVLDELDQSEMESRLHGVGLAAAQLTFKLTGWFDALSEWRETRTAEALRRAFRWANVMLGSMEKVVLGMGLDLFKEFKESSEALLDEAVVPGGYLPAPVAA